MLRYGYFGFCILLLLLAALPLYLGLSDPSSGWDFRVYSGAVQALNHNENPYVLENVNTYTGENLPFTYPPHTLFMFWLAQVIFITKNIWAYYFILVVLLVIASYLIISLDQKPDYLFYLTLAGTAFIALFWNFITGNKDIVFLFLFSVILYFLVRKKFWQSSIVMGLMGSISLITIPFMAMYLVIRNSLQERLKYILISCGVLAGMFFLSFCINPTLFFSYLDTIGSSTSPLYDAAGYNTPTPFTFFSDLLTRANLGGEIPVICISLLYLCFVGGAAWYCIRKNRDNLLKSYALAMVFIFMILPRIKPYDFIILVIPLYLLFKDCTYQVKMLILAITSLLPVFVWYYPWIEPTGALPYVLDTYPQTISLFLIGLVVVLCEIYFSPQRKPNNTIADKPIP
jgi:Protein of unknown function (DUF2029).